MSRRISLLLSVFLLASCAAPDPHARVISMRRTELYFGRNTNTGGHVSDADWSAFVDQQVTPRFPAGVTILDADGQWTDPKGALVREDSRVIILLYKPTSQEETKIEAIRSAYVKQFSQDAVMRVDSAAQVRF